MTDNNKKTQEELLEQIKDLTQQIEHMKRDIEGLKIITDFRAHPRLRYSHYCT